MHQIGRGVQKSYARTLFHIQGEGVPRRPTSYWIVHSSKIGILIT